MKTNTLFRQVGVLLIAALLFTSCSKSDDATSAVPGSTTVIMKDMKFLPYDLRVMPGAVINWVNADTLTYSVTADDGSFESGDILPGKSYSRPFNVAAVYNYHSRHGFEMKGTITVTSTP